MAKALFGKADLSMNQVITIGRELGSGGRTVGKEVARLLNIPYYDRELIDEAAKESGLSSDFIENNEQEITSSFLYNLAMGNSYTYGMLGLGGTNSMPLTMQVFLAQQKVIQKYAANPCVIVGRCADFILRERPMYFVFSFMLPWRNESDVQLRNMVIPRKRRWM